MIVASNGIISVPRQIRKNSCLPAKLGCESAYAANADVITTPAVTTLATTNEFTIQRGRFGSVRNASANTAKSSVPKSGKSDGETVGPCSAMDSDAAGVRRYMQANGYRFPVVLDEGLLRHRFTSRRVVPMTCLVDRQGRLMQSIPGEMAESDVLGLPKAFVA